MATSTGSAPAASSAEATCRSRACTAEEGWLARTASRFRSWVKLSISPPSASSSLPISSWTGSSRDEAGTSRTAASWATVNRRPIDAATAATFRAPGDMRARRRRMPSRTRSGSRASTNVARPAVEADEMLLAQTGEQLQEKERVPPHAVGQGQQGVVGSGAEDVSRHFGDSARLEAPENRLVGPVAKQFGDGAPQIAARLDGSEGQHPADRQRSQAGRQGAYRGPWCRCLPIAGRRGRSRSAGEARTSRAASGCPAASSTAAPGRHANPRARNGRATAQPRRTARPSARPALRPRRRARPPRGRQRNQPPVRPTRPVRPGGSYPVPGRLQSASWSRSRSGAGPGDRAARPSRRPGRAAGSTWHRALREPSSARAQVWRSGRQRSFRSSHSCTHKSAWRTKPCGGQISLPGRGPGCPDPSPGPGRSSACPFDITRLSLAGGRGLGRAVV